MEENAVVLQNRGMWQDAAISRTPNEYSYENHNIRISSIHGGTELIVTNEKGWRELERYVNITYLGSCQISNHLVVFGKTNDGIDKIIKYSFTDGEITTKVLYSGNLKFVVPEGVNKNIIECIPWYESEDVQKIYWVDGVNSTRVINVVGEIIENNDDQFDVSAKISHIPSVRIKKDYRKPGLFAQGTIQYFITYYKKYGSETSIVWQSSLQYISFSDRGAKEDENVSCGFDIVINNIDYDYDYIRLYAASRTSNDSAISLRVVGDIEIPNKKDVSASDDQDELRLHKIRITDYGTTGYTVDSLMLQYIGGQDIVASTLTQKDGVMFLGDINTVGSSGVSQDDLYNLKRLILETTNTKSKGIVLSTLVSFDMKKIKAPEKSGYYSHRQEIDQSEYCFKTFKHGQLYRFALQFMNKSGQWTDPIWCGDRECDKYPQIGTNKKKENEKDWEYKYEGFYLVPTAVVSLTPQIKLFIKDKFIAYRLLCADLNSISRTVVAQGIVCPTVFNLYDRSNNAPTSMASWTFRPRGSAIANRHYENIGVQTNEFAEIQGITEEKTPFIHTEYKKKINDFDYWSLIMGFDGGHEIQYRLILFNLPDNKIYEAATDKNYKITESQIIGKKGINNTTSWSKALNWAWDTMSSGESIPFSRDILPSTYDAKKIISSLWGMETGNMKIITELAVEDVSLDNSNSEIRNQIQQLSKINNFDARAIAIILSVLGGGYVNKSTKTKQNAGKYSVESSLSNKGWMYIGDTATANNDYFTMFSNTEQVGEFEQFKGNKKPNGSVWVTGGKLSEISSKQEYIEESKEQFFIDESRVTLNSPDIINNADIDNNESLMFRIIGTIPVDAIYNKCSIETEYAGYSKLSSIIKYNEENSASMKDAISTGLYNGYLYQDAMPSGINETTKVVEFNMNSYDLYKVFMWNRETSLSVGGGSALLPNDVNVAPLKRKVFANMRYSYCTDYNMSPWVPSKGILCPVVYKNDNNLNIIKDNSSSVFYSGYYDNVITFNTPYKILTERAAFDGSQFENVKISDPVRIKYSSTEHAVISFNKDVNKTTILPGDGKNESVVSRLEQYDSSYKEINADLNDYGVVERQYYVLKNSLDKIVSIEVSSEQTSINYGYVYKEGNSVFLSVNYDGFYHEFGNRYIFDDNGELYGYDISTDESARIFNESFDFGLILIPIRYELNGVWGIGLLRLGKAIQTKAGIEIEPWEIKNLNEFRDIKFKGIIVHKNESGVDQKYGIYKSHCCLRDGKKYTINNKYTINKTPDESIIEYNMGMSISEDNVTINDYILKSQYMFMGELYRGFSYESWLGGHDDNALKLIDWNICSSNTNINQDIKISWGDTYYQRWDCLKTYPSTEEDKNSVVDIFSFMVETYKNIDGRCDVNRGLDNILNARPSNWNLMNDSYSQNNNVFKYKILDEKFDAKRYKNQIVWSQKKANLSDIDTWTNINLSSTLSLDGRYGSVTKLDTVNNTVVVFQDKAINSINFNARTQLSTEQGLPVEIANSGKVDGYDIVTDTTGCQNKFSLTHGGDGVYYMDDLSKSFFRFGKDGIENLGVKYGMSVVFKNNSVLRSIYDKINNDVYIVFDDGRCVDFCERTNSFTSFMPYGSFNKIENIDGCVYGIINKDSNIMLVKMFDGNYGENIFDGGLEKFYYSMEFDVNDKPFEDKVFTNIEYSADVFNNDGTLSVDNIPFDSIDVSNEYQTGHSEIIENPLSIKGVNQFRKFRIRRVEIPRDNNSRFGLDRIRSQWCRIKLSGTITDMQMKFHQAAVKYFK